MRSLSNFVRAPEEERRDCALPVSCASGTTPASASGAGVVALPAITDAVPAYPGGRAQVAGENPYLSFVCRTDERCPSAPRKYTGTHLHDLLSKSRAVPVSQREGRLFV